MQQAIDRAVQGTTALVIAHRLSTVLHADQIVVLGRGGVEAIGRHAELLGASETYRQPASPAVRRRRRAGARAVRRQRGARTVTGALDWSEASVLVTGGTGSFGNKFVEVMLERYRPRRLVVFSRDELKQSEMMARFKRPRRCASSSATCATATGSSAPCTASTSSSTPPR